MNGPDAEKAYQGFLEFKDVVEKNQVATASAPAVVPSGDKIGEAAKALSDASYPFIKDIDWLSDIYLKPLPGKTAPETLKAIDKMIVMGAKMDGNLLKAAAEAHHKAIGSIDATGVTSAADYEAVNAAIGRLVASVPKTTVMDVYNSMAGIVDSQRHQQHVLEGESIGCSGCRQGFLHLQRCCGGFPALKVKTISMKFRHCFNMPQQNRTLFLLLYRYRMLLTSATVS